MGYKSGIILIAIGPILIILGFVLYEVYLVPNMGVGWAGLPRNGLISIGCIFILIGFVNIILKLRRGEDNDIKMSYYHYCIIIIIIIILFYTVFLGLLYLL